AVHDAYLYANEDGFGVSLSLHRASLNATWAVHRVVRGGVSYFLFHSTAYGRYLSMTRHGAPPGHGLIVQRDYSAWRRRTVMSEASDEGDGTGDVVMRNRSEMMSWVVEAIPPREGPPELPDVIAPPALPGGPMRGGRLRSVPAPPVFRRRIRYVRANDQEELNALVWSTLWFNGRSVSRLREVLANELGEEDSQNITLCVRAGSRGRLTPLIIDLPDDEQIMEIVVFTTGSKGESLSVLSVACQPV
uniref:DUF569 domain-containing protein n=1 Tax=Setaria italica TaxID=4555 RepID=K3Y334_SETIT